MRNELGLGSIPQTVFRCEVLPLYPRTLSSYLVQRAFAPGCLTQWAHMNLLFFIVLPDVDRCSPHRVQRRRGRIKPSFGLTIARLTNAFLAELL